MIRSAKMSASARKAGLLQLPERAASVVGRNVTEVLFDPQQLVVFRDAIGARQRSGLDLASVGPDRDVGDHAVLGFARPVRNYRRIPGTQRHVYGGKGLGERSDLVDL